MSIYLEQDRRAEPLKFVQIERKLQQNNVEQKIATFHWSTQPKMLTPNVLTIFYTLTFY